VRCFRAPRAHQSDYRRPLTNYTQWLKVEFLGCLLRRYLVRAAEEGACPAYPGAPAWEPRRGASRAVLALQVTEVDEVIFECRKDVACRSPWVDPASSARPALQPSANVDDRAGSPLATTSRRKPAIIEYLRGRVCALAIELGQDLTELLCASISILSHCLDPLQPHLIY
jgi:hypothetical protein